MNMNHTPASERVHISFFGVRNVGKSSVVNAVTGQELSIVSEIRGTTTDPVRKTMELLPIGPVVIIDTPGIDDVGALGEERVRRTKRILNETDLAVLVVSAADGLQEADRELIHLFEQKQIPFLVAVNKTDLLDASGPDGTARTNTADLPEQVSGRPVQFVSALTGKGIWELKEALGQMSAGLTNENPLAGDLVRAGDLVILVVPIDKSAPKGRLILPQQMVIRSLLDAGAIPVVTRDSEYGELLSRLLSAPAGAGSKAVSPDPEAHSNTAGMGARPVLVITDSQVFDKIAAATPEDLPLTSFSMLMARYKGSLEQAVRGAKAINNLKDGDTVLISEGCTHHRQCEDIGTVKFPKWLNAYTGKKLQYAFTAGRDFPEDLSPYALVIHCGGCMLNEKEMRSRCRHAEDETVPMTNYGVAIAEIHGILDRCTAPLLKS